jgi:hypothetical protein
VRVFHKPHMNGLVAHQSNKHKISRLPLILDPKL